MTRLTNAEYVNELNRRLESDPSYRQGTRVVAIPSDVQDSARGGSTWVGPDEMLPTIVRIVKETAGQYEVEHPFVVERG